MYKINILISYKYMCLIIYLYISYLSLYLSIYIYISLLLSTYISAFISAVLIEAAPPFSLAALAVI